MEQRQAAEESSPAAKLAVAEQISEKENMRGFWDRESLKLERVVVESGEEIGVADGEVQKRPFWALAEEECEGLVVWEELRDDAVGLREVAEVELGSIPSDRRLDLHMNEGN